MAERATSETTSDREIVLSRLLEAPRERVFDAFTDPQQVDKWWGPQGFTTTTEKMDVRPGGLWVFTMHGPDGTDYPNWVRYLEVDAPRRLVYDQGDGPPSNEPAFRASIVFEHEADQTRVSLRTVFPTPQARDHVVKEYDAIEGGKQTLARLAAHVEKK